jgi:60 kDa SS-A/Ro ribonucleoprotein
MSKFNSKSKSPVAEKTVSKDGISAFKPNARQDLCERVLTSFFGESRFYESGKKSTSELQKLIRLVATEDPVFVAKLAVLAREEFNLRSVSHALVAELSRIHRGDGLVSTALERIVKRPDDMLETLSYVISDTETKRDIDGRTKHVNKAIPNQIKKGIAASFGKFDEYQLSKYRASNKDLKLRDLLSIARPKPADDDQAALWNRLMKDELATAETWETAISSAGQKAKGESAEVKETLMRDAWEEKIMSKKLGYMAGLRNIRNIIDAGVSDEAHTMLQNYLSNEKAVANSKQLPFRFYSAYKALIGARFSSRDPFENKKYDKLTKGYIAALNKALYYSGKNIPKLKGRTVIMSDLSGSMNSRLSENSEMTYREVAAVLSTLAGQFCEEFVNVGFATQMGEIKLEEGAEHTLDNIRSICQADLGYGTNAGQVFNHLKSHGVKSDNVLIFTDTQLNYGGSRFGESDFDTSVKSYRQLSSDVFIYQMNLAGYSSTQLDPKNARNIYMTGWSDGTLKYITEYQRLRNGIVDMVNGIKLG